MSSRHSKAWDDAFQPHRCVPNFCIVVSGQKRACWYIDFSRAHSQFLFFCSDIFVVYPFAQLFTWLIFLFLLWRIYIKNKILFCYFLLQDTDSLITNLKTIQDYLCSFKSQVCHFMHVSIACSYPLVFSMLFSIKT